MGDYRHDGAHSPSIVEHNVEQDEYVVVVVDLQSQFYFKQRVTTRLDASLPWAWAFVFFYFSFF